MEVVVILRCPRNARASKDPQQGHLRGSLRSHLRVTARRLRPDHTLCIVTETFGPFLMVW
jgi:hypothetical protein